MPERCAQPENDNQRLASFVMNDASGLDMNVTQAERLRVTAMWRSRPNKKSHPVNETVIAFCAH